MWCKFQMIVLIAASCFVYALPSNSQEIDANQLFVDAVTTYHEALIANEAEKAEKLLEVRALLDQIVLAAPNSRQGLAISSGGIVAGIDINSLPQTSTKPVPPSYKSMTGLLGSSDLKTLADKVVQAFPSASETIESQLSLSGVKEEATVRTAFYLAFLYSYLVEHGDGFLSIMFTPESYHEAVSEYIEQGKLASGANLIVDSAEGVAEDYAKELAASVLADLLFARMDLQSQNLENTLRAGAKATLIEGYDAVHIYNETRTGNPWALAEKLFQRYRDIEEVVEATNALSEAQDQGLIQTALNLEASAYLITKYPTAKSKEIVASNLRLLPETMGKIVGADDAKQVTGIFNLGFVALRNVHEGNNERAQELVKQILSEGRQSNITPFALFTNPQDWLVAASNWGKDAPQRAAEILIGTTVLSEITGGNDVRVHSETPPTETENVVDRDTEQETKSANVTEQVSKARQNWSPAIVMPEGVVELNKTTCRGRDPKQCLIELGATKEAASFAVEASGTGTSILVTDFVELGDIDVAEASVIWRPYETSFLVNGSPDSIIDTSEVVLPMSEYSHLAKDADIRSFPNAIFGPTQLSSYRLLPDDTQRFIYVTTVLDGCMACGSLGTATTYLDFPANAGSPSKQAIALNISNPSLVEELTADLVQSDTRVLKQMLNGTGYNAGPTNGLLTQQTRHAILEFQEEHCLPLSGTNDRATAVKIFEHSSNHSDRFKTITCQPEAPLQASSIQITDQSTLLQSVATSESESQYNAPSALEHCIDIDNDIERLACYDASAKAPRSNKMPIRPIAAFGEFLSLISIEGPNRYVDAQMSNCKITIRSANYKSTISALWYQSATFDAAKVDLEKTRGSLARGANRIRVVMQRGESVSQFAGLADSSVRLHPAPPTGVNILDYSEKLARSKYWEKIRDAQIDMVAEPFQPDADDIRNAFYRVIEACQKNQQNGRITPTSILALDSSDAFRAFTEFSQQSGSLVLRGHTSLDFRLTDCVFESSYSEITPTVLLDGWYSKVDLRQVKSIQPHSRWGGSIEISMNRGATITGFTIWPGIENAQVYDGAEALTFFREISGTNHKRIDKFEERTRGVKISLEDEDREEALSLFGNLVASCQDS